MDQSKRFELHVYLPFYSENPSEMKDQLTLQFPDESLKTAASYSSKESPVRGSKVGTRNGARMSANTATPGLEARFRFSTRIRCFDARSYFLCMTLVKERAFGFINQRHFSFIDVDTGEEHGLKSKAVKAVCKATSGDVGDCYRFRSTIRNG